MRGVAPAEPRLLSLAYCARSRALMRRASRPCSVLGSFAPYSVRSNKHRNFDASVPGQAQLAIFGEGAGELVFDLAERLAASAADGGAYLAFSFLTSCAVRTLRSLLENQLCRDSVFEKFRRS